MKHKHWDIIAYAYRDENKVMQDAVSVNVQATSEKEAMKKARKIIKRKGYWLQKVWECTQCAHNEEMLALQKKMWGKLLPLLKKSA